MRRGYKVLCSLMVGMFCVSAGPEISFADQKDLDYEIVCPPNDGTTVQGGFSDEPLKRNLATGRVTRIFNPTSRAIAKLACENANNIAICCNPPSCEGQCEETLDSCLEEGNPEVLCFEEFEDCLETCQPPPCPGQCEEVLISCLEAGNPEQECLEEFEACLDACQPPSCEGQCEETFNSCLEEGNPEAVCFEEFEACLGGCT